MIKGLLEDQVKRCRAHLSLLKELEFAASDFQRLQLQRPILPHIGLRRLQHDGRGDELFAPEVAQRLATKVVERRLADIARIIMPGHVAQALMPEHHIAGGAVAVHRFPPANPFQRLGIGSVGLVQIL